MLRIALCGYGYWGKNLARVLNQLGVLVAICDSSQDSLKKALILYPNIVTYTKTEKLLRTNIDAVVIATPPQTHFQIAYTALLADKHVFVEKPMTTNSAEAETLIRLANQHKKILQVGHTFVYNSGIQLIKDYIKTGMLGKVKYIDIQQLNLGKYQKGGVVLDLAAHGLSIADYLLDGEHVKDINVSKGNFRLEYNDWSNIVITYYNGTILNLNISWFHPVKTRKFTVVGDEKMIIFDDIHEPRIQWIDKSVRRSEDSDASSWGTSVINYNTGNIVIPNIQFKEPLTVELKDFIKSITTGKPPISDAQQGFRVVKIMEKLLNDKRN